MLDGAAETVTWDDGVYAFPQWANTQVLWYRKSLAEAAGLDMTQPVTWDQVIDAASEDGGTVGVQANKYEAYVVWINSLIQGAGGDIISDNEAGKDAQVDIDGEPGKAAAAVIQKLADSPAAQADLTTSNEGTSLGAMFTDARRVHDQLDLRLQELRGPGRQRRPHPGAVRRPRPGRATRRRCEGEESRPPVGGIDIGVGAYSKHPDYALAAGACVTSADAQVALAVDEGLMPSRTSAYEDPKLAEAYPADLLELYSTSVDSGGPRPKSAYYATISAAVQSVWHSPTDVDPDTTPEESARFIEQILRREGPAVTTTVTAPTRPGREHRLGPPAADRPGPRRDPAGPAPGRPGHRADARWSRRSRCCARSTCRCSTTR